MLIPTMSVDMDEQLKVAQNVVDIIDRANRKICVTMLRYSAVQCEFICSFPKICRRNGGQEGSKIVYVSITLEDYIYLLDVLNFL